MNPTDSEEKINCELPKNQEGIEIDITLPQKAYAIFESLNYTVWNAIGEFIDNSIQSHFNDKDKLKKLDKDYRLRIDIKLSPNKLEISDNAGGIDENNLKRGLKPAIKPEFCGGLSEFGMGMKTAAFWICRKWKIISKHFNNNKEFVAEFNNADIYTKDVRKIIVYPNIINTNDHYTKLVLQELIFDWTNEKLIETLKENLTSMYRHYLRDNEIDIYFGTEKLNFKKYEFLRTKKLYGDEKEIEWKKKIDFTLISGKKVFGFAGLLKIGNPTESGFTYFRRNRVIEGLIEGIKFNDIQSTPNTQLSRRLVAELNLDDFRVSHTKDTILFDNNEQFEFKEKLKFALNDDPTKLLYQGRNYTVKEKEPKSPTTAIPEEGTPSSKPTTEIEKEINLNINMNFHDPEIEVKGDLNKMTEKMKEAYGDMYKIENIIRKLIMTIEERKNIDFLDENNYPEIENKKEIRKIKSKIEYLKNQEVQEGTLPIRGNNDLFYTNFDSLKTIIDFNYDNFFSDFFMRKNETIAILEKLYFYRNNIAHNAFLGEEEINYIRWALKIFFIRQLAKRMPK